MTLNLHGKKFGQLTILEKTAPVFYGKRKLRQFICLCECGNRTIVVGQNLMSGHTQSCGCIQEKLSEAKKMLGRKFGRLTVAEISLVKNERRYYRCSCVCGGETYTTKYSLETGETNSCGCYHKDAVTTHGMYGTRTHKSWDLMIQRCQNSNAPNFTLYGGRGITICERWHRFENFLADMGERPVGKTLDRVDSNSNYEPSNCRWATPLEQTNNRRCSKPKLGFKMVRDKPIPIAVRRKVLRRANGCCEECGERKGLALHHLTYVKDGNHDPKYGCIPIFGYETPDDLRALCRDCHHDQHIGPDDIFYTDPEECAAEWDYYDHMMSKN